MGVETGPEAIATAESIREVVAEPIEADSDSISITMSIGVAPRGLGTTPPPCLLVPTRRCTRRRTPAGTRWRSPVLYPIDPNKTLVGGYASDVPSCFASSAT